MAANNVSGVTLVQDEPWVVLDARKNPQQGRRLTYRLLDGTMIQLDVTNQEYMQADRVRAMLQEFIDAHSTLTS